MTPSEFQDSMRKSLVPLHALLLSLSILLGSMVDFRSYHSDAGYHAADMEVTDNTNDREIVFKPFFDLVLPVEEEGITELVASFLNLQAGQKYTSLISLLLGSHYIALPPPSLLSF